MHDSHFVQGGAAGDDLPNALLGDLFGEADLLVEKVLQAAAIGVLENAIVVGPCPDDLL